MWLFLEHTFAYQSRLIKNIFWEDILSCGYVDMNIVDFFLWREKQIKFHCYLFYSFQEYMLHNAMSIFTFVGGSLAQHDDIYSFQLITLTINTIIPALITVISVIIVFQKRVESHHYDPTELFCFSKITLQYTENSGQPGLFGSRKSLQLVAV